MKQIKDLFSALSLAVLVAVAWAKPAEAAVPGTINYQGKLVVGNTNYLGTAYFKFALVNATDNVTYWSNDGTSSGGQIPNTGVELTVVGGLFNVALGDTRLVHMTPLPASAFANGDAKLRVWFSTQPNAGYQVLSPDQPLRSVPYAQMAVTAERVGLSSIGNPELANGAVTGAKIAPNAVSTGHLADGAATGSKIAARSIGGDRLARGTVTGEEIAVQTIDSDKLIPGRITSEHLGPIWRLASPSGSVPSAVTVNGNGLVGIGTTAPTSQVDLWGSSLSLLDLVMVGGDQSTPVFRIFRDSPKSDATLTLSVDRGGTVTVNGLLKVNQDITLATGQPFKFGHSVIHSDAGGRALLDLRGNGSGPVIDLVNDLTSNYDIRLELEDSDTLRIRGGGLKVSGAIQSNAGGDFAEPFEIEGDPKPGMLVSIYADHPGGLRVSDQDYDEHVAGIVSGAGGVNAGLVLRQEGTIVDGDHLVALAGRVYCLCDALNGEIRPGDLLTTSKTPGHAMKAADKYRAVGATVGKALTGLKEGRGLVLVLVSTR